MVEGGSGINMKFETSFSTENKDPKELYSKMIILSPGNQTYWHVQTELNFTLFLKDKIPDLDNQNSFS